MVAYSEDVSLLEESIDINKGTEAQSDTRKDSNPENRQYIWMSQHQMRTNALTQKHLVCHSTINNAQFSITLGNSWVH